MTHNEPYLPLYDAAGNLYGVMISAEVWQKSRHQLEPLLQKACEPQSPVEQAEPLDEWKSFCACWDFKYPLTFEATCGHCGAHTDNWELDPAKPFRLKSAQLGGLVVFACKACGATVRKKHFKDHYCFEVTPVCPS